MIVHIYERTNNLNINRQVVRVLRVYNRNIPAGISADAFGAKGDILVGTGDGTYTAFPAGATGTYLKFDSSQPAGVIAETPTFTIDDTENHLVNGEYIFAQDQTSGTLTTVSDGGYGPDQWIMTRENADFQYVRQAATSETGLTSYYYGQFKKITNAGKLLICQPLEFRTSIKFRGKTASFQLQLKASSSKTIKIAIVQLQAAGTADTLPSLVSSWNADGTDPTLGTNLATIGTPTTCSVTTSWQTFQVTGTFPTTAKNLLVMVWANADFSVNDTLSLAEAGLYFGAALRTWTARRKALEQMYVEYFYRKSYEIDTPPNTASAAGYVFGLAYSTSQIWANVYFAAMRISPVVTLISIAGVNSKVSNLAGADVGGTVSVTVKTEKGITLVTDSGTAFTAGTGYAYHFKANARL